MPRKRDPKRDEAKAIWLKSNETLKLVDLAKQMEVTPSTIRKWKAQDKWDHDLKESAPFPKGSAPKRSNGCSGGQPGNQNAKGHGPPKRNQNAIKHGFFSKFLPTETLEIMENMNESSPEDVIWDQIQIQYAAIIRAQKIMFVTGKEEMIKELKKEKEYSSETGGGTETEWEFQFAWDRQATFLNAQSRAMGELRSLIKQFNELSHEDDERRLKLKQMQVSIERQKHDMSIKDKELDLKEKEIANKNAPPEKPDIDSYIEALKGRASEVWKDEEE